MAEGRRSQSAMEYLMTYGWAILIIAVVLAAIYSLGLFNGAALGPKASPGACDVIRPNGAGTTPYISLAGTCTNIPPQYVSQFSGVNSYINVANPASMPNTISFTLTAWGNFFPYTCAWGTIVESPQLDFEKLGCNALIIRFISSVGGPGPGGVQTASGVLSNQWIFLATTVSSSSTTLYINGVAVANGVGTATPITINSLRFGQAGLSGIGGTDPWTGYLSNIQIYNTSLDANSIKAIYQEGVGGAPINLQNLAGWWPLNGNANDYSGNINNGQSFNGVTYTNQWANGYTVP